MALWAKDEHPHVRGFHLYNDGTRPPLLYLYEGLQVCRGGDSLSSGGVVDGRACQVGSVSVAWS